jgi:zona occludens toxin (predicted ATPase)
MPRLTLLLSFLVLAACDRGRSDADADAAAADSAAAAQAAEEAYVPPQLTPAESTAAVARQRADADAATRRVMGPDYKPPTDTFVDTPQKQYESCMTQARTLEEPVKSTVLAACERFRDPNRPQPRPQLP